MCVQGLRGWQKRRFRSRTTDSRHLWHVAKDQGIHLVHLPASTPELQPAGRLWPSLREAVANECFADLAALDAKLSERCNQLSAQPAFLAGCTHYHWWPQT